MPETHLTLRSDRAVEWGDILTLDASASIDLDGAPLPGAPSWQIDYSWDCFTDAGDACLGTPTHEPEPLSIPSPKPRHYAPCSSFQPLAPTSNSKPLRAH